MNWLPTFATYRLPFAARFLSSWPLSVLYLRNSLLLVSLVENLLVLRAIHLPHNARPVSVFLYFVSFRCNAPLSSPRQDLHVKTICCIWISLALRIAWQATIFGFELRCSDCRSISLAGYCTTFLRSSYGDLSPVLACLTRFVLSMAESLEGF